MAKKKTTKTTKETVAPKLAGDAAIKQKVARYFKQIKASRARSARAMKQAERLIRETDAVLARLEAAS
jgi:hypothetical protein